MPKSATDLSKELQAANARIEELEASNKKLNEQLATVTTERDEIIARTGIKKKVEYEYGEDECRPLNLGDVCDKCGFDYRSESRTFRMKPFKQEHGPDKWVVAAHPVNLK